MAQPFGSHKAGAQPAADLPQGTRLAIGAWDSGGELPRVRKRGPVIVR